MPGMQGRHMSKSQNYKQKLKFSSLLIFFIAGAIFVTYILSVHFHQAPWKGTQTQFDLQANHKLSFRPPHQHVYYLKTHKTGSSTMCLVFAEYCRIHHLLPLLPRSMNINQKANFKKKQLLLIKGVEKYDMVFNHHIFTPEILRYLHNDTFAVTSLREPFENFVSAFYYYRYEWRKGYLLKVKGDDPLTEFLGNPEKYEKEGYKSWTNNRQSVDLGFDLSQSFDNIQYIKRFINKIEHQFNLVLIMEYFDEGLIMVKRILCWKTEDILYVIKNKGKYSKQEIEEQNSPLELEKKQRKLHALFSQADIMLYDYFLDRFKQKIRREIGFAEEVAEFKEILRRFWNFCDTSSSSHSNTQLVISAGKWNTGFNLTRNKCEWLGMECYDQTKYLQGRQQRLYY